MYNMLYKEFKLSASVLSYLFIVFGVMFMLPGYPVLCGAFFVTMGIFQSFQNIRETNDIVFSALLPFAKREVVKGKYLFVCFIEFCSLIVMAICVLLRMTFLKDAAVYRNNALMNGNLFALGLAFVIFASFNVIFLEGFFKTAYKIGKPFVCYIISTFCIIGVGESLHYFPKLEWVNAFGTEHLFEMLLVLLCCITLFLILTLISYKKACMYFDNLDL